ISSPFAEALKRNQGLLGTNASEASMFFLAGAFLIPIAIWLAVHRRRRGQAQPVELLGVVAAVVVIVAFVFIPGWDAIAHLLYLDRVPIDRMRIGLGVASFAIIPLLMSELEREGNDPPAQVVWIGVIAFAATGLALAAALVWNHGIGGLFSIAPLWTVFLTF